MSGIQVAAGQRATAAWFGQQIAAPWIGLTLAGSWANHNSGTPALSYRLLDAVNVQVTGRIDGSGAGNFAVLPPAITPVTQHYGIAQAVAGTSAGLVFCTILVQVAGTLTFQAVNSGVTSYAMDFIYPLDL